MRVLLTTAAFVSMAAMGCGGKPDYQQIADDHVRTNMLNEYEKREAIAFFDENGRFFDEDGTTTVDRDIVLPLLKRLKEVAPTDQWALLRPKETDLALAVLIELPKDLPIVDRMAEAVEEADDRFSGLILQQWGHEWLVISLIDQKTYETLKKSNPNVDKQRERSANRAR